MRIDRSGSFSGQVRDYDRFGDNSHRARGLGSPSQHAQQLHFDPHARPNGERIMIGNGYLRADGRKGIRNVVTVVYLVECAHHVARRVVDSADDEEVHLVGFPGCYPNDYAFRMMLALTTHPNVGGAVLISLGCEGFNREGLADSIRASGRPCLLYTS